MRNSHAEWGRSLPEGVSAAPPANGVALPAFCSSAAVRRIECTSLRPSLVKVPGTVSLAMGEPDFDTPPAIVEAAIDALRAGHTRYTDFVGDADLREALAAVVGVRAGSPFTSDQILVTHGASAGLAAAILAIVNPGDRVVIPEPSYSLYSDLVEFAGGTPVFVPLQPDFHLDMDRLGPALGDARLLVLCTPGNPTGAVYTADEWAQVAAMVGRTSAYLLTDEAYCSLVYDDVRFTSGLALPQLRERLVYAQTFSKTYAMTGWRIGYLAGPPAIVKAAGVLHRAFNGTNNAFVQRAAVAGLAAGTQHADRWLAEFAARRTFAVERLRRIAGLTVHPPQGGFYAFVRYAAPIGSTELAARMQAGGVAVRAGREYGPTGESHFRISFATDRANLALGIDRIAAVMGETSPRGSESQRL